MRSYGETAFAYRMVACGYVAERPTGSFDKRRKTQLFRQHFATQGLPRGVSIQSMPAHSRAWFIGVRHALSVTLPPLGECVAGTVARVPAQARSGILFIPDGLRVRPSEVSRQSQEARNRLRRRPGAVERSRPSRDSGPLARRASGAGHRANWRRGVVGVHHDAEQPYSDYLRQASTR